MGATIRSLIIVDRDTLDQQFYCVTTAQKKDGQPPDMRGRSCIRSRRSAFLIPAFNFYLVVRLNSCALSLSLCLSLFLSLSLCIITVEERTTGNTELRSWSEMSSHPLHGMCYPVHPLAAVASLVNLLRRC